MIPSLHFMSIMHNSVLNHTGTKNSHLFHPARQLNASFIISRSEIFVKVPGNHLSRGPFDSSHHMGPLHMKWSQKSRFPTPWPLKIECKHRSKWKSRFSSRICPAEAAFKYLDWSCDVPLTKNHENIDSRTRRADCSVRAVNFVSFTLLEYLNIRRADNLLWFGTYSFFSYAYLVSISYIYACYV
jgi:hypothetical protein